MSEQTGQVETEVTGWTLFCPVEKVSPDSPVGRKLGSVYVGVYELEEGGYSALDDVCPHEFALLSAGFVEEGKIECPLHQALFDIRTGKCFGPLADRDLKRFEVKVEGGNIYVKLD